MKIAAVQTRPVKGDVQANAEIYLASVVKSVGGIDKALGRLSEIARSYSMTVIMANSVGICDGEVCAGKSSFWNEKGELLGQLSDTDEGILIFDTLNQSIESVQRPYPHILAKSPD